MCCNSSLVGVGGDSGQEHPQHGGNLQWAAHLAKCAPEDLLDFSSSINPLGPPASALAALQAGLTALKAYPDPAYRRFREAVAAYHQLPSPDWVLPGNGAAELLTWAARDLSSLDAVGLVVPAFGDYERALRSAFSGSKPNLVRLPLDFKVTEQLPDFAPLQTQGPRTKVGLLLNNPHNPTGWLFQRSSLEPWLSQLAQVVVDEAFMDFLPPELDQSWVAQVLHYPNLVVIRSLTKFYSLPGLRIGYAIAQPETLRRWQQWRDPWPVNCLAERVTEAVLQDYSFQQQTLHWLPQARAELQQSLDALPGFKTFRGRANFLLVQSEQPVPALQRRLVQQYRLIIRDCLSFPELGAHYFRVAVRTQPENQRLTAALNDLLQTP
ncbi:threonine-phosphate decarboxylase CobD [Leptolyngbya sp. FACHB-261]|uniref:threonine-phosphate decarboxylase CobD n=1 Tax=Leptolyngbya sp. FACHB-261 TaxID=2692806 RepID=UPI0016837AA9|nr:threonine-phosphate decarboxylase CobD [Leptolyngbya sp. FACHB-261]MBD2100486.1 threonine-phosphate decarboxylase [Leptolyngbya sp. FACHB-261]